MKCKKSAKVLLTLLCVCAAALTSGCQLFQSENSEISEDSASVSAAESSAETSASDNKNVNTAVTLSDEQKSAVGTRTIDDFYKTVTESKKQDSDSENTDSLIKKYMIDKINTENCHFIVRNYGRYETQSQNNVQEIQYSDKNQYYKITNLNSETDYQETFIHKDGKVYWLIFDGRSYVKYHKQYLDITEDEDTYVLTPPSFDEESLGKPVESGKCTYYGKEMQYEIFGAEAYRTIAYFYDGKPYMIEGYVNDTYSEESDSNLSDFKLVSYMSVELNLDIDQSLYEIPSDFRKTTFEEFESQVSEIQANISSQAT